MHKFAYKWIQNGRHVAHWSLCFNIIIMYKYIFMSKMIFAGRRTDCIINDNFPVVIPTYTPNLHKHAYELYVQNGRHLTYL